jgi:hypothetical protein
MRSVTWFSMPLNTIYHLAKLATGLLIQLLLQAGSAKAADQQKLSHCCFCTSGTVTNMHIGPGLTAAAAAAGDCRGCS